MVFSKNTFKEQYISVKAVTRTIIGVCEYSYIRVLPDEFLSKLTIKFALISVPSFSCKNKYFPRNPRDPSLYVLKSMDNVLELETMLTSSVLKSPNFLSAFEEPSNTDK